MAPEGRLHEKGREELKLVRVSISLTTYFPGLRRPLVIACPILKRRIPSLTMREASLAQAALSYGSALPHSRERSYHTHLTDIEVD